MEIWKQYKNTNYEISNTGKVRNKKTKKELKQQKKYNGKIENDYMCIGLYINKKGIKKRVHRLVAECFLENYDENMEVNHKNSIRYDNRVDNLEMCTREYNHDYSIKYGNGTRRRTVYAIDKDGKKIEFNGLWSASKFINNQRNTDIRLDHICSNIKQVLSGKVKTAYGYKWGEYK